MEKRWFKERAIYQIYPKSFCDSNGDGIGDLRGIISKADYIKSLNVGAIWLSPIYDSPMDDNGYDISDYYSIHKDYGTMEDFKELLYEFHKRDIKVIMDLVVNHTSDEHIWFKKALESKENKYQDYYFFRKGDSVPNNWTSFFGGSSWEYVPSIDKYYLHLFSKKQPDLNWDNSEVRNEIKKIIKFWLDMGVDGFRCDVINLISKDPKLPDGKGSGLVGVEHYANGVNLKKYLRELEEVHRNYDIMTVGECGVIGSKKSLEFTSGDKPLLNMVFNFDQVGVDGDGSKWNYCPYRFSEFKRSLFSWQEAVNGKGWNALYLENHDQPRSVSRFGDLDYRKETSKLLAMLTFLEQGTPFIYQGEELGIPNSNFDDIGDYKDVETLNFYRDNINLDKEVLMNKIKYISRDNARTPMQWDDSEFGGFSNKASWIKLNPSYKEINVKKDLESADSIIEFYKKLLKLRQENDALIYGDFKEYEKDSDEVAIFKRSLDDESFYIVLNFTNLDREIDLPFDLGESRVVLDNYDGYKADNTFKPYEGKVFLMTNKNNL